MPHSDGVVALAHTSETQQLAACTPYIPRGRAAGGARLTLLLILPIRMVDKWVPGEPWEVKEPL